jgi:ankyrin repeat protein
MLHFFDTVQALLNAGGKVDAVETAGHTPLTKAAEKGHVDAIQLLLAAGADVILANALHRPAELGDLAVVDVLLATGADVTATTPTAASHFVTPLHFAARAGHVDVVRRLLAAGADADAKSKKNETPLHGAAHNGHLEVCRVLLEHGCDVNAVSVNDDTALMAATAGGHVKCARLLTKVGGANPAIATRQPSASIVPGVATTPLMHAACFGDMTNDQRAKMMRQLQRVCANCGKTDGKIKSCSQCRAVWYCGTACQRSDWPTHKHACMAEATAAALKKQ